MKFGSIVFIFIVSFLLITCKDKKQEKDEANYIKTTFSKGSLIPKDIVTRPETIVITKEQQQSISVGTPETINYFSNVYPAGSPNIVPLGKVTNNPIGVHEPAKVLAFPKIILVGSPERIATKDPYLKDENSKNFISYTKLQGLKHAVIPTICQDKSGNLWFGSLGGVSKFDGAKFTNYTTAEGLSDNVILSSKVDKSGNIWFGTESGGISKFDGLRLKNYNIIDSLPNVAVRCIIEDKLGNMWFGTEGEGLLKFDGNYFTHYTESVGLVSNNVYALCEDHLGNIWIGYVGEGISKFNGTTFTNYSEKSGLSNNLIVSILEDKSNNLWFATQNGVNKFDGKRFIHYTEKEGLPGGKLASMCEDEAGNIWFGTEGNGVAKFTGKKFVHYKAKDGLIGDVIISIFEDSNGNIWFGSANGVSRFNGRQFSFISKSEGLTHQAVFAFLEDKKGDLWLGTDGGGLAKFDGKKFEYYTTKQGLSDNVITNIVKDKFENIWIACGDNGVCKFNGKEIVQYNEKNGFPGNYVRSMVANQKGVIWMCCFGTGVVKCDGAKFTLYTTQNGLLSNDVWSSFVDSKGNVWFGSRGKGVTKFDGKQFHQYTAKNGFPYGLIRSMLEDQFGNIWFSSAGDGIIKYDGKTFVNFTEKEGLSSNVVLTSYEDKFGNIWFGSRFGLNKLSNSTNKYLLNKTHLKSNNDSVVYFKIYNYDDGFLGVGVNAGNTMMETKNGNLWIASNNQVAIYPLSDKSIDNSKFKKAPIINISKLSLFYEDINWVDLSKNKDTVLTLENGVTIRDVEFDSLTNWSLLPINLSLSSNNNYLNFNFIGITMNQPKRMKYQFKLDGFDDKWSVLSLSNEAAYANLSPGKYTFRVKARNSDGLWSEEFAYDFTIRPPYWKTWWFRTIVVLFSIFSVWYYIKRRERNLMFHQKELELKIAIATDDIIKQKLATELKHKEISDSINYAGRIQRALLASKSILDEYLKITNTSTENNESITTHRDYFILFKPKDVISGDFYWAAELNNGNFVLVTADSTGHGIPGAIMSILNMSCLKEAVLQGITSPDLLLNETRRLIIESLKNDGSAEGGKDGMDGSLLSFNFDKYILEVASANNPVWIVRGSKLIEVKYDRMPIGKNEKDHLPFVKHTIQLEKGDVIYTLTDGFSDQFGGDGGKKFKTKQLQELLVSISHNSMEVQHQILSKTFDEWKTELEQVDDVCVIGIKL